MIRIERTNATITSINPRAENHGPDTALACDIKLEMVIANSILDTLDEGLLASLYQRDPASSDDGENQEALDLDEGFLSHLRFPGMGKFPWKYEGAGYRFQVIDDRLHGDKVIELADCKVNHFQVEPLEGGTVTLTVRVQCNPSEEEIGDLCHHIKREVDISLIPPLKSPQQDLVEGEEDEPEAA